MACGRGLIKGAFLCTKRTSHLRFTTRKGLEITLSDEKKRKELDKEDKGVEESNKF